MTIYLAGTEGQKWLLQSACKPWRSIPMLQSYYYLRSKREFMIPDEFMLDSGAFTFIDSGRKFAIDWNRYADEYADFVKEHNVTKFFELDIDPIVGHAEVVRLRDRIEKRAGRQCIPVWHRCRGKDEFLRLAGGEYRYISIGGVYAEIGEKNWRHFPWFISKAHENGVKIHGLGVTGMKALSRYHFDSTDSTTWLVGDRFANICVFGGNRIIRQEHKSGGRCKDVDGLRLFNFNSWVRFQEYAARKL